MIFAGCTMSFVAIPTCEITWLMIVFLLEMSCEASLLLFTIVSLPSNTLLGTQISNIIC